MLGALLLRAAQLELAERVLLDPLVEQAPLQQIDRVLASMEPRDLEFDHLLEHRIDFGGGLDGVGDRADQLRVLGLVGEDPQVLGDPPHTIFHGREHLEDACILDLFGVHTRQSRHSQLLPADPAALSLRAQTAIIVRNRIGGLRLVRTMDACSASKTHLPNVPATTSPGSTGRMDRSARSAEPASR